MAPEPPRFPPRPSQPPGHTVLSYTPSGARLNVGGTGNFARSYRTNDTGEPDMLTDTHEDTLAIASGEDFVLLGCEDGSVVEYEVPSGDVLRAIVRFSLPVRALALLGKDAKWLAACSDEVEVKIVNRLKNEEVHTLGEMPKPAKHLTVSPDGRFLAVSCTDGIIYVYDVANVDADTAPTLFRTIDGVARALETTAVATSAAVWHPDGRAFAVATATREIQIVSIADGAMQRSFAGAHAGDITALAWSGNGALLASAATDDTLVIWETKTQSVLRKNNYEKILQLAWHPGKENLLCWTNSWGECSIQPGFLEGEENGRRLRKPVVRAPFWHDPLDEKPMVNGAERRRRDDTPDSLDEMLAQSPLPEEGVAGDLDDWIVDDDNAGYTNGVGGAVNGNGKRTNGHLTSYDTSYAKRSRIGSSALQHAPFQPASTPWRGNRRYLCLNLIGFVWTVDHDTHRTVTVEFFDRERYRDFHFTDYFGYDKACLTEHGTLFSSSAKDDDVNQGGLVFYRPHETWVNRSDGGNGSRFALPKGEEATSIALGKRYVVAVTNRGYVRVWTLFGTPVRVWRVKNAPAVACASWDDFVMILGNGPVGSDGRAKLVYSIEDLRDDVTLQSEDVVALSTDVADPDNLDAEGNPVWGLQSVFWSATGDPCIYDTAGVLLTLLHWRTVGQAKWVPLLDTRRLARLQDGKRQERYWPVAVADEKFHCVILKGSETSPYFPRPLLTEFDFEMPVGNVLAEAELADEENNDVVRRRMEERFVRESLVLELLRDGVDEAGGGGGHRVKAEVARREVEVDKLIMQLVAAECREGEDRGMKAVEVARLTRDRTGRILKAIGKVASRWEQGVLEEKILELAEQRHAGLEEE
jgi:chromosome transmission fidelity protein 4